MRRVETMGGVLKMEGCFRRGRRREWEEEWPEDGVEAGEGPEEEWEVDGGSVAEEAAIGYLQKGGLHVCIQMGSFLLSIFLCG